MQCRIKAIIMYEVTDCFEFLKTHPSEYGGNANNPLHTKLKIQNKNKNKKAYVDKGAKKFGIALDTFLASAYYIGYRYTPLALPLEGFVILCLLCNGYDVTVHRDLNDLYTAIYSFLVDPLRFDHNYKLKPYKINENLYIFWSPYAAFKIMQTLPRPIATPKLTAIKNVINDENYSTYINYINELKNTILNLNNLPFINNIGTAKDKLSKIKDSTVQITGVTCVGKTTFINNNDKYKIKPCVAFKNRDTCTLQALLYGYIDWLIAKNTKNYICDRTCYDNLIWRLILRILEYYYQHLQLPSAEYIIDMINEIPYTTFKHIEEANIIIVLEENTLQNKIKMALRNDGSDFLRSKITHYITAQNIVYGLFAALTNSVCISQNNWEVLSNYISNTYDSEKVDDIIDLKSNTLHVELINDANMYKNVKQLKIFK